MIIIAGCRKHESIYKVTTEYVLKSRQVVGLD